jgi:hypothetical protein
MKSVREENKDLVRRLDTTRAEGAAEE